jgi:cytoskeletal protein CcmA (bactofilin family)
MIGKSEDKKSNITEAPSSATPTSRATLISQSMLLEGDISGQGDLVIQGQVRGKISLKGHDLTVARSGRVKAEVWADNISIQGSHEGRLQATGKVTLHAESNVSGDITAGSISIAEGAVFKGSLKIQSGT